MTRYTRLSSISLSLLSLSIATNAFAAPASSLRFRVTVQNVTAANAISPFLAVALKPAAALFEVGAPASAGIAAIAESGNTGPLQTELAQNPAVITTAKAAGGPILAGATASVEIEVSATEIRRGATLNVVAMIGRSNDSFISIRGLSLASVANARTVRLPSTNYDAGSEENTGNVGDFGNGGHPTAAAEGHVSNDRGLNPRGDAAEILAWGPVAAIVTVERLQ